MFYKNCSCTAKTFYGVTFEPGQVKQVDGIINDRWVVPADDSATVECLKPQQKPSSEQLKEEAPTPEPTSAKLEEPKEESAKTADVSIQEPSPAKVEEKSGKGKKS